ncbi:class I SAM-dependent methyltransferase [Kribbella catacumbae]|uniref:class I SAM-dependent methyltransferase n=1 Tax=Kribbella catacumbae TaxID=460086 RepID=UPI000376A4F8|nr:class I SAM-dependent methyltransferase [Kribbella catacumbae]
MTSLEQITAANRASWNQIAPARLGQPADFFGSGGLALEDFEQELAGDVRGKRVLQLACSCGDEVLSWANLGATAIGIDISDVAISMARQKATAAGISADFRQANMFDLPADLVDLDLIYLSWGAICWAPDLDRLTEILASRLASGGSVLLADHHPIWEVLAVRGQNHLAVAGNYFGRNTSRRDTDNAKLPFGARDTASPPPFEAFVWPTSDIVMSLLRAGLHLTAFTESPAPDSYSGLGSTATQLPAYYVIKATKS